MTTPLVVSSRIEVDDFLIDEILCARTTMTNKSTPANNEQKATGTIAEYFRISKAAEILQCSSDDILHLGVIGKAEILAPVVSGGKFEWMAGSDEIGFAELDDPFLRVFDATDRVILQARDLAHIEAVGWVIPHCFSAPYAAIDQIELILEWVVGIRFFSESEIANHNVILNHLKNDTPFAPWTSISPDGLGVEKTTINHLFIGKLELQRMIDGRPQDSNEIERNKQVNETPKAPHGNIERNAKLREEVLRVAIYCLLNWPEQCKKDREWTRLIELEAPKFWPQAGEPPLKPETIERLLGKTRNGLDWGLK